MTKVRVFLFAALAVAVALGVSGPAQAAGLKLAHGALPTVTIIENRVPATNPDTVAAIAGGPVWWGQPIAACFAGTPGATCAGDPAGGVDVGYPLAYWPVGGSGTGSTCNNVVKQDCGLLTVFAETGTAVGAVSANFIIKQGATTIYKKTLTNASLGGFTTTAPNEILALTGGAFHLKATAKAGTATLTAHMKVGTAVSTSTATIDLVPSE
jgi:hypothetical protein